MNERAPFFLSLIVAIADNGVIGREGTLPWRLSSDLQRFRKLTLGHPLIMGRKTFEAIGKPLDGRDSIVVTRNPGRIAAAKADGVYAVPSLDAALTLAQRLSEARGVNEAFVIGGAELFTLALPNASRIYLTLVHGLPEGDIRWEPQLAGWSEVSRQERPAGARDDFPVADVILDRANSA